LFIAIGHNFRGAGARQCATEKREERKPGRRGCLEPGLNITESLITTIFK